MDVVNNETMTPHQQIDFIFLHLKEKIQYGGSYGYNNLWFRVEKTPETKINKTLFNEIIERLKQDNLITETKLEDAQPVYHITFKGLLFDGYEKEYELARQEKERLERIEDETLNVSRRMNRLTWIIMIGTAIAALYYLLEILNHWLNIYPKSK